jgi:hypothetical protein
VEKGWKRGRGGKGVENGENERRREGVEKGCRRSGEGMEKNGEGMDKEWIRNGGGMEEEWIRNGGGMDKEWRRNGEGMERREGGDTEDTDLDNKKKERTMNNIHQG